MTNAFREKMYIIPSNHLTFATHLAASEEASNNLCSTQCVAKKPGAATCFNLVITPSCIQGDATARGLALEIGSSDFIAFLLLLPDVLSVLGNYLVFSDIFFKFAYC